MQKHGSICKRTHTHMYTQGEGWRDDYNLDAMDDSWEEVSMPQLGYVPDFPFQSMLFKFLDTRAPLPGNCRLVKICVVDFWYSQCKLWPTYF